MRHRNQLNRQVIHRPTIPKRLSELTAINNGDVLTGASTGTSQGFNLLDDIHTSSDSTENNVLAIEPWAFDGGKEELGTVGVWARVSHGQQSRTSVSQLEVLIWELATIDGHATSTVALGEVTTLQHEVWNDTVEDGALEPQVGGSSTLLTSAESSMEVR